MNIITGRVSVEENSRGYIWYDTTVPDSGYRFKWSLAYDMIPEPKIFSKEYMEMYPDEFEKPNIIERVLTLLKIKNNIVKRKYKYD